MRQFLLISVILYFCGALATAQKCVNGTNPTNESTRLGGNEIDSEIETQIFQKVYGFVRDANDNQVKEAIVEIFDNPVWIKKDFPYPDKKQRRIIGCTVANDGRFGIRGLPKGEYEMRVSVGSAWNVKHLLIKVDPNIRVSKKSTLIVYMKVGT